MSDRDLPLDTSQVSHVSRFARSIWGPPTETSDRHDTPARRHPPLQDQLDDITDTLCTYIRSVVCAGTPWKGSDGVTVAVWDVPLYPQAAVLLVRLTDRHGVAASGANFPSGTIVVLTREFLRRPQTDPTELANSDDATKLRVGVCCGRARSSPPNHSEESLLLILLSREDLCLIPIGKKPPPGERQCLFFLINDCHRCSS